MPGSKFTAIVAIDCCTASRAEATGQCCARLKAEYPWDKAMGFYSDWIEHVAGNEFDKMPIKELYESIRSEA